MNWIIVGGIVIGGTEDKMNGDDIDKLTKNILLLKDRMEQFTLFVRKSVIGIFVLLVVMFLIGVWFGVRVI